METLVMEPTTKSNVRVTPNFSRTGTFAKPLDAYFISLTKQVLAGRKPSLKFEEVEEALASGKVSLDVIDDLEDAMFGAIMVESLSDDDDEYVSEEEIMKILDE